MVKIIMRQEIEYEIELEEWQEQLVRALADEEYLDFDEAFWRLYREGELEIDPEHDCHYREVIYEDLIKITET